MIIDFSELLKNWANPQDQQIKDKAFIYSLIDQPPTILKNGLTKYFNDLMENKHPRGMQIKLIEQAMMLEDAIKGWNLKDHDLFDNFIDE